MERRGLKSALTFSDVRGREVCGGRVRSIMHGRNHMGSGMRRIDCMV